MPHRSSNSPGVHPVGFVVGPAALCALGVIGGAAEAAILAFGFRWIAPLYSVIALVAAGATLVWMVRAGRIRGVVPSLVWVLLAPVVYFAGAVSAAYLLAPEARQAASSPLGLLFGRYEEGLRMTGDVFEPGGTRVGGIWILLLWLLEAGVLLLIATVVAGVENQRPYCDRCGRWANMRKWTFGLEPMRGLEVDLERGLEGLLLRGVRVSAPAKRIEYAIDTCRCEQSVAMSVTAIDARTGEGQPSEKELLSPHLLSAAEVERVFAWAERIDPMMATARPALAARETEPGAESAAALPPLKRDSRGEVKVRIRWNGAALQEDYSGDTSQSLAVRSFMKRGNHRAVEEILRSATDPTTRAILVEAAASWEGTSSPTGAWVADDPSSPEARLASGIQMVKQAWSARGGDWTPKNFPLFRERLEAAKTELLEAAGMDPADGVAHAWLILCAKGLQEGPKAAAEHFKESVRRQPSLRQPHTFLVQALCSKWGGDDEQMLEFARKAAGRAAVGSTIPAVLAEAHLEFAWAAERGGRGKASDHMTRSDVRAELVSASARTFPVNGPPPSMDAARAREVFAQAMWHAGAFDEALAHLELLPAQPVFHRFTLRWMFWSGDTRRAAIRACRARRLPK